MNGNQFIGLCAEKNAKAYAGDFNGDKRTDIALLGARGWSAIPILYVNAGMARLPNAPKRATASPLLPVCDDEVAHQALCQDTSKQHLCNGTAADHRAELMRKQCPKTCGMCVPNLEKIGPDTEASIVSARGPGSQRCHPHSPYAYHVVCTKSFMQFQDFELTPTKFLMSQCHMSKVIECHQCGKGTPPTMCSSPAAVWNCHTTKRATCSSGCMLEGTGISWRAYHSKTPCANNLENILQDFSRAITSGLPATAMNWQVTYASCDTLRNQYDPQSTSPHAMCQRALFSL